MRFPSPGWPVSRDRSQPRRFTARLPEAVRVFFLPRCPPGLCSEVFPLANAPREPLRSGGFGWRPDPCVRGAFALGCICTILGELGSCSLLRALGLSPQNKTGPCSRGSHRTALVPSIQHPGESMWLASKNCFNSLSHQ